MKTKKPPENAMVAKDNSLIKKMAKFKLSELRLIAYCLAHYDSRNSENKLCRARVSELTDIFPMSLNNAYKVVREAMIGINQKPLEFQEGSKKYFWNWFSGFSYDIGAGEFEFKINPDIKPYILGLTNVFSSYRLAEVAQFRSQLTWLLFENINKWKTARKWSVDLDELKSLLGLSGMYPKWYEFSRCVLDRSVNEINELTKITVSYEKQKHVRAVIGVTFFIDEKQPEDTITLDDPREAIHRMLLDCGLNNTAAQNLVSKIEKADKLSFYLDKIPKIIGRHTSTKGPKPAYITKAINGDLSQLSLFDIPKQKNEPPHKEALDCWTSKRQTGEVCKVRQRGAAGNRKKCQMCLEKISVEDFGI